ncbi:MAG: hypothetical protein KDE19_15305 [Caldilineaceae bacterium]|nr:hypothetical protein [Caldilineaceae bacterium]
MTQLVPRIYIVGCRGLRPDQTPDNFFYVGERCRGWPESPLHCAFPIIVPNLKPHAMRLYKAWLWEVMQDLTSEQYQELAEIAETLKTQSVILGAWDTETDGHAYIIKRAVEYLAKQEAERVTA